MSFQITFDKKTDAIWKCKGNIVFLINKFIMIKNIFFSKSKTPSLYSNEGVYKNFVGRVAAKHLPAMRPVTHYTSHGQVLCIYCSRSDFV